MSMSISRGPLTKLGVRPTIRSIRLTSARRRAGDPVQAIAATAFKKGGWSAKPTGSLP
jgi:hypothetical protein